MTMDNDESDVLLSTALQNLSVTYGTCSVPAKKELMHLPDEMLMPVLGMLDSDTIRHVMRHVNERFHRLSSDFTFNCRVKVPEYWPPNRVPDLLSTKPLQEHLHELELRDDDQVQQLYQFLHERSLRFETLASITCGVDDLSGLVRLHPDVFTSVTPKLEKVVVRGQVDTRRLKQMLFSTESTLWCLRRSFPKLQLHFHIDVSLRNLPPNFFYMLQLPDVILKGSLDIRQHITAERYNSFRIPIEAFMDNHLIEAFDTSRRHFADALLRHATTVSLAAPREDLSHALVGVNNATTVKLYVTSTESLQHTYASKCDVQPQSLQIRNHPICGRLKVKYYKFLLLQHSSSLTRLKLVRCSVSRSLLSVLPASLRRLRLCRCDYEPGAAPAESYLQLVSLGLSFVANDLLIAVLDFLPVKSGITDLRLTYCRDEDIVGAFVQRCALLTKLHTSGNAQPMLPSSLKFVSIGFDMHTLSHIDMSLDIMERLFMSPVLMELQLWFIISSDHMTRDVARDKVALLLKQVLSSSARLTRLTVNSFGPFGAALAFKRFGMELAGHQAATIGATLDKVSRPNRTVIEQGNNTYTYSMVPRHLC